MICFLQYTHIFTESLKDIRSFPAIAILSKGESGKPTNSSTAAFPISTGMMTASATQVGLSCCQLSSSPLSICMQEGDRDIDTNRDLHLTTISANLATRSKNVCTEVSNELNIVRIITLSPPDRNLQMKHFLWVNEACRWLSVYTYHSQQALVSCYQQISNSGNTAPVWL